MRPLFTPGDTALLLIDHQVGTMKLAASTPADELLRNTRALARTAVEAGIPLVLTSSQEDRFQGPLIDDLQRIAPEAHAARIRRPGVVDCWRYAPFLEAVQSTGRRKLVLAGLTNDVCIVYPALSATADGYEVQVVVDAGGSPTRAADDAAISRMRQHGVGITSTNQILAELAVDWSTPEGSAIQRVMYEETLRHLVERDAA